MQVLQIFAKKIDIEGHCSTWKINYQMQKININFLNTFQKDLHLQENAKKSER